MKSIDTESDYTVGGVAPSRCLNEYSRSHSRGCVFGNEGTIAKLKCHFQEPVIGVNAKQKMACCQVGTRVSACSSELFCRPIVYWKQWPLHLWLFLFSSCNLLCRLITDSFFFFKNLSLKTKGRSTSGIYINSEKIKSIEEEQELNWWQVPLVTWYGKQAILKLGVSGREKGAVQETGSTSMPGERWRS